ncbi:unnamed protein product [Amoebophrya sp. A120]|nr:unnamed protein product [Amoebophrya sp. A120]|eukprot:GSA120T00005217001.1
MAEKTCHAPWLPLENPQEKTTWWVVSGMTGVTVWHFLHHRLTLTPFFSCMTVASDTFIYIILEYAGRNSLFDLLAHEQRNSGGPVDGFLAQRLFLHITEGLAYCHGRFVCHRDLKPENFIMETPKDHARYNPDRPWSSDSLKIADFGLAATLKAGQRLMAQCGSMPFAAPEVMAAKSYDGFKLDVWSIGVVLLELTCGVSKMERLMRWPMDGALFADEEKAREIFQRTSNEEKFRNDIVRDFRPDYMRKAGNESIKNLLNMLTRELLVFDEARRSSITQIEQSPWVVDARRRAKEWGR